MDFRFVGSGTTIVGDWTFNRFGQRADFSVEEAQNVLAGGGAIVRERTFLDIGFTPAELRDHAYPGSFPEPSSDYLARKERAQAAARELMASPEVLTETSTEQEQVA